MTDSPSGPRLRLIPDGDDRERLVCPDCGYVAYDNPKMVSGVVVVAADGRLLLCRRAIEPRKGFWTMPAGYLELGESPEEGARREAWEEARAHIAIDSLLAIYTIPHIGQVQMMYRATMTEPGFAAGPESEEVRLFHRDQIPWDDLAFPSGRWALEEYFRRLGETGFLPTGNPPGITGYVVQDGVAIPISERANSPASKG